MRGKILKIVDVNNIQIKKILLKQCGGQEGDGRAEALADAVAELREAPRELAELYNDFAAPWGAWGTALQLVDVAQYTDAGYVRQLWDVYLRQVGACLFWRCACFGALHKRLSVKTRDSDD